MRALTMLTSSPVVCRIAWALVQFTWQGALVALDLALALALFRRQRPALRYGLCCAALLLMLVLPLASVLGPGPGTALRAVATAQPPTAAGLGTPALSASVPAGPGVSPLAIHPSLQQRLAPSLPWLFAAWLGGVLLLSLYQLGGWWQVRRLASLASGPVSEPWQAALARLCLRLGMTRRVEMLRSCLIQVPMVIGWLHPVVLVPTSIFTAIPAAHLEAVLAHELAHIRRHDYLVNLLQALVETVLFYHPAVWWVSRQTRIEREHCCDDLAVYVCGDSLVYARALSELEALRPVPLRLVTAADSGSLLARIRRIAAPAARRRPSDPGLAALLGLTVLLAAASAHLTGAAPRSAQAGTRSGRLTTAIAAARPEALAPAEAPPVQRTARMIVKPTMPIRESAGPEAPAGSVTGSWIAERVDGRVRLELTAYGPDGKALWNSSLWPSPEETSRLAAGPAGGWHLHRAAGDFFFQDGAPGGSGTLRFTADSSFVRAIEQLGYGTPPSAKIAELAVHDVTPGFLRELRDLGYEDLPLNRAIELRVHGIGPELIRELARLGYDHIKPNRLVEMGVHGVTPEFIRALQDLGYRDVPVERLIELRALGVTPELIREAAARHDRPLSLDDILSLRAEGAGEREP